MQPSDGLLRKSGSEPEAIQQLYDDWASRYDDDLQGWGYEAPRVCAAFLQRLSPSDVRVLDAGCGTGISGQALATAGFRDITGIDFSSGAIERARSSGIYSSVRQVDLTELPTPFSAEHFGALVCVGVMSYLENTEATCREFCRLVKRNSPIVLTQRSDLFEPRRTRRAFDALLEDGTWEEVEVTDSRDYLPGNPEFADVGVRYCVFRRR